MEAPTVQELREKSELDRCLAETGGSSLVIHFWASWCEASAQMDLVFQRLCSENASSPNLCFYRVEAEECPEISEYFGVVAVPFFVFVKDGVVVDKLEGANPADLAQKVAKFVGSSLPKKIVEIEEVPTDKSIVLKKKLEGIVASKPVVLFMKGTPSEPKCGFSRKVVDILKEHKVEIGSFDILTDEEVRQGMKEFSNWPTFPQLYISGEFVGGCDIITEMQKNGELKELLTEKGLIKAKELTLEERLKALVNSSPTMLFMKGSPDAPRCGFSSKVVNALREENIAFDSFDILSDNEVREGLKKYSNWPTYPQLYHNGELIGGCDIILELKATGELKSELS